MAGSVEGYSLAGENYWRPGAEADRPAAATHFRWVICGSLFFAPTLNYMHRQVLSLLKLTLQDPVCGIGLTNVQFEAIVSIFSEAYAPGQQRTRHGRLTCLRLHRIYFPAGRSARWLALARAAGHLR